MLYTTGSYRCISNFRVSSNTVNLCLECGQNFDKISILVFITCCAHLVLKIVLVSGKKYEDICPSTHNMDVPHVKREDYQLTDISDDGYLCLMADNGDLREDLRLPEGDLGNQLRSDYDAGKELLCTVLKSCGEEVVIAIKTNTALDK